MSFRKNSVAFLNMFLWMGMKLNENGAKMVRPRIAADVGAIRPGAAQRPARGGSAQANCLNGRHVVL